MVVVVNASPAERRGLEDTFAAMVEQVSMVPSYPTIPDEMLADRAAVKQRIVESGVDGAAIFRLVDTRQEQTYVPPTVSTWNDVWGWNYGVYTPAVSPGYTMTDTFVRGEISLYEVPSGKLLWAAASETVNPANPRAFATDVMKAAVKELRKVGLVK
jgi:hypothetical protein